MGQHLLIEGQLYHVCGESGEGVEMVIKAEAGGGMEVGGWMEAEMEGEMGAGMEIRAKMMEMIGMMEETARDRGEMDRDRATGCDRVWRERQ